MGARGTCGGRGRKPGDAATRRRCGAADAGASVGGEGGAVRRGKAGREKLRRCERQRVVRGIHSLALAATQTREGAARVCDVHSLALAATFRRKRSGLRPLVNVQPREAAGVVGADELGGVGAGREIEEEGGIAGGGGEGKCADSGARGGEVGYVGVGRPAAIDGEERAVSGG